MHIHTHMYIFSCLLTTNPFYRQRNRGSKSIKQLAEDHVANLVAEADLAGPGSDPKPMFLLSS